MAMQMPADWSFGATIPAKDIQSTRRFYEDVLELDVVMENPAGITYRSGDSYLSLYPTQFGGKAEHTLGGFLVRDFDAAMARLRERGVKFEDYDIPDVGIKTVDGVAELEGMKGAWSRIPRATSFRSPRCRPCHRPNRPGGARKASSLSKSIPAEKVRVPVGYRPRKPRTTR